MLLSLVPLKGATLFSSHLFLLYIFLLFRATEGEKIYLLQKLEEKGKWAEQPVPRAVRTGRRFHAGELWKEMGKGTGQTIAHNSAKHIPLSVLHS